MNRSQTDRWHAFGEVDIDDPLHVVDEIGAFVDEVLMQRRIGKGNLGDRRYVTKHDGIEGSGRRAQQILIVT